MWKPSACVDEITKEVRGYDRTQLFQSFLDEVLPEHPEFPSRRSLDNGMALYAFIQERGGITWAQNMLIEVRVRKCNK